MGNTPYQIGLADFVIIRNSLNPLTPGNTARTYLLGKQYEARKKRVGERGPQKSGQNVHSFEKTAEQIAEEQGINEKTVRRAAEFSQSLDTIAMVHYHTPWPGSFSDYLLTIFRKRQGQRNGSLLEGKVRKYFLTLKDNPVISLPIKSECPRAPP